MAARIALEKQRARAVAEEYRRKGYEVIEEPDASKLPNFLAGYQPDLLARRGNEAIIVEVKARSSLGKPPEIRRLARLLREKPGWNFELVIVGESGNLDLPDNAQLLGKQDIAQCLAASDRLLDAGHYEAALLLAWSALEATIRLLLEGEDPSLSTLDSKHVLNHAVSRGVISRRNYNSLLNLYKYRNAAVHGFKISDSDLDTSHSIIKRTIENLLQSPSTS